VTKRVEKRRTILFVMLCFFHFLFVMDYSELRLSVTMTALTIFNEQMKYNA